VAQAEGPTDALQSDPVEGEMKRKREEEGKVEEEQEDSRMTGHNKRQIAPKLAG